MDRDQGLAILATRGWLTSTDEAFRGTLLSLAQWRREGAGAPSGRDEAPLEILKRRLARGEITREEYDAIKKELS